MSFDLSAYLSGLGGVITGGAMFGTWIFSMREEIRTLRDNHIHSLAARISKIEDRCAAETFAANLDAMKPMLTRIEGKVDEFTASVARIEANERNTHAYVSDVNREFTAHRGDRSLHSGGAA